MNKFKFLTTLFFVFSFILLGAEIDQQKFNQANKHFRNFLKFQRNNDLQLPNWLYSSEESSSNHFQKPDIEKNSRDIIDIKINGEDQTTIVQGEDIVITIYFSDNCFDAYMELWVDMNDNGTWEENIDLQVPDNNETFADNDPDDEDPTVGVYQITITGEDDGPNNVSNLGILFLVEDDGGFDEGFVFINSITSDYSVAGSITPVAANIIIMAMNEDEDIWMTTTDPTGDYQNFVQEPGLYFLMAFDPLGVFNGMFSTTVYNDVDINDHLTGYDFNFVQGNSTIEGTVTDENGDFVEGVTVYAQQDESPGGVWDITDQNGFYQVLVIEGAWEIGLNDDDLMPDYMEPEEAEVYIEEGDTQIVDFMIYETDSFIEGTVYLDGIPATGFEIQSWNDLVGGSFTISGVDGSYDLPVASEANASGGYYVQLDIWDIPGIYVDEYYSNIITGSSGIDFHIHTATGGINGYIYDSVTLEPIDESWISAYDGVNYYSTGTDNGYYQLYLPNGTYEVWAQGDMYYQEYIEDIVINDVYVHIDFYLDPISFEGSLSGMVLEEGTTNPIPFAELSVWNDDFWSNTTADENGNYYFDMPNGTFTLSSQHPLYYVSQIENIEINSNAVTVDIEMEPIIFSGALEGYVYEENSTNPIPYANIEVYSEGIWFPTMSDEFGYYHFDLPNSFYSLDCWKNGYLGTHIDNIEINNNVVDLDIYLIPDVEADQLLEPGIKSLFNYPNPFNPETTISFSVTQTSPFVTLEIYNIKGQKVKTFIINTSTLRPINSMTWNGTDQNNKPVSSGIYFYKLKSGDFEKTKKMILMK